MAGHFYLTHFTRTAALVFPRYKEAWKERGITREVLFSAMVERIPIKMADNYFFINAIKMEDDSGHRFILTLSYGDPAYGWEVLEVYMDTSCDAFDPIVTWETRMSGTCTVSEARWFLLK